MSTLNGGPGNIVTNGLILYLDAANSLSYVSGSTTWRDLSSTGNNGALTNGPTYSSANGGSIVFDGTNDICDIQTTPLISATAPQTLNAFCKLTATGFSGEIISLNNSATSTTIRIYYHTDNKFYASVVRQNIVDQGIGSSVITDTNNFYMITGVFTGTLMSIYINGVFVNSTSYTTGGISQFNSRSSVGASYNNASPGSPQRYFNGRIATAQIYDRALTASEILQNYNSTKARFGL